MIQAKNCLTTPIGKRITRNLIMGTEQPAHVSLPTEIGGHVKFLVGIANSFRNHTENQTDPTIQPIIVHSNQSTRPVHSDWYYLPLRSLDSGTDVPRSRRNIDNLTGMKTQGHIGNMIPESNSASKCEIFKSTRRTYDISYRVFPYHGPEKSEIKILGGNKTFKNADHENNFEVEKVDRKNSIILNHKYSDSIHVDPNHTDSNQLIPDDLKNIGSINNSDDICAIEKIILLLVNLVHSPFTVPSTEKYLLMGKKVTLDHHRKIHQNKS